MINHIAMIALTNYLDNLLCGWAASIPVEAAGPRNAIKTN